MGKLNNDYEKTCSALSLRGAGGMLGLDKFAKNEASGAYSVPDIRERDFSHKNCLELVRTMLAVTTKQSACRSRAKAFEDA